MPVGATTSTSAPLTAASTISRCLPRNSLLPKAGRTRADCVSRLPQRQGGREGGELTLLQDPGVLGPTRRSESSSRSAHPPRDVAGDRKDAPQAVDLAADAAPERSRQRLVLGDLGRERGRAGREPQLGCSHPTSSPSWQHPRGPATTHLGHRVEVRVRAWRDVLLKVGHVLRVGRHGRRGTGLGGWGQVGRAQGMTDGGGARSDACSAAEGVGLARPSQSLEAVGRARESAAREARREVLQLRGAGRRWRRG